MEDKAKLGDKIKLTNQEVDVVKCETGGCGALMVNIDAGQLRPGDLTTLKGKGVRISNPETDKPICLNDEYKTLGRKVADWFESDDDDDDDSTFFRPSVGSGFGGFGGGSSSGGGLFGGGSFGGFGGGSFGGGGASRSF